MEPCGIPQDMGVEEEDKLLTLNDLLDKYEDKHFKAEPETL